MSLGSTVMHVLDTFNMAFRDENVILGQQYMESSDFYYEGSNFP